MPTFDGGRGCEKSIDSLPAEFHRLDEETELAPFQLSPLTAVGFLRIVTNPGCPNGATPLAQAVSVVESLAALSHCIWTPPGKRHWELTRDLCNKCSCAGKNVADAQHAAIAIEHAGEWITRDRDFNRFVPHGLKLQILEP